MPNSSVRTMRYNKETPITDRMALVQTHILDHWGDFFQNNWLNDAKSKMLINDTKSILDRCATFILLADMRKNNILSKYKINSINQNEIHMISDDDDENQEMVDLEKEDHSEPIIHTYSEIKKNEQKVERQIKKWRNSKTRKLHKLYTLPDLVTYRIKPKKDDNDKVIKNVYGQSVLDAEYTTIGNQKGLIDKSKPYVSEWCLVDTNNDFSFNGKNYKVDKKVKQYKVEKDNQSQMDKILCILVNDELHFFDQNIDEVNSKHVKQV